MKNREVIMGKSKEYYEKVVQPKRKQNVDHYRKLDRERASRQYAKKKELILQLRMSMGGKCSRCEYDNEPRILNFHHLGDKVDNVTNLMSLDKIRVEAKKCILLCPNCHALEHL